MAVARPAASRLSDEAGLPEGDQALLAQGAMPLRGSSDVEALLRQVGTPDIRAAD